MKWLLVSKGFFCTISLLKTERENRKEKKMVERVHCSTLSSNFATMLLRKALKEPAIRNLFS
jgi:hypothetical protein